jgi:tetratricopeptide (TPR) repeat protein
MSRKAPFELNLDGSAGWIGRWGRANAAGGGSRGARGIDLAWKARVTARNLAPMRRLGSIVLAGVVATAAAQDEVKVPEADKVIAPMVAKLPAPQMHKISGGVKIAISAASEKAQQHVLQGIELVFAGWDFEAYRHFCAALKEDPECLMAHWGTAIALAQGDHEFIEQREAAIDRMVALGKEKNGSEIERGCVYCLLLFYQNGSQPAASAFRKLSEQFPNAPLPAVMAAILGRTGFDDFGDPTPEQQRSETILRGWMARQPDNLLVVHSYLSIRAEAPSLKKDLEMARDLSRRVPTMPGFRHLLGHYEWRCGNFREAAASFGHAASAYDSWMRSEELTPADCPGWVRAEVYRSVALASAGDYDSALAAASSLGKVSLDVERVGAPGSRLLMWEARTLGARLLLARRAAGDAAAGLKTLPKPGSPELQIEKSDARYYYQGLATVLEGRMALEKGNLERASELSGALTMHGNQMAGLREKVTANGEVSHWRRALPALQAMAAELRGDIAMAGPKKDRGSAYNWFLAADDRQEPGTEMMPPAVLVPMRARVGDYLLDAGRPEDAEKAYREALELWPGNQWSLRGLKGVQDESAEGEDGE